MGRDRDAVVPVPSGHLVGGIGTQDREGGVRRNAWLASVVFATLVTLFAVVSGPVARAVGQTLEVEASVTVWELARWPVVLLAGNAPGRILCLTFTKAAAANMANKVLETLSSWVQLDDAALDAAIREVSNLSPSPDRRAAARRLFAQAVETPGGLKVQTIHAFCDRVLHQFPMEARVQAGFAVLDDVQETALLQRARERVLIEAASAPESALGRALADARRAGQQAGVGGGDRRRDHAERQ